MQQPPTIFIQFPTLIRNLISRDLLELKLFQILLLLHNQLYPFNLTNMKRWIYIILGLFFSGLGIVGVFLPILPTFPFAVAALFFFSRSSIRFKNWLLNNRFLGPSIRRFQSKQGLSVKTKAIILLFTWFSVGGSMVFIIEAAWIKWMLAAIMILQAWVIIGYKTYKEDNYKEEEFK